MHNIMSGRGFTAYDYKEVVFRSCVTGLFAFQVLSQ